MHVPRHLGVRHEGREGRTIVRLPGTDHETLSLEQKHEADYFLSFFGFFVSFLRALLPLAMMVLLTLLSLCMVTQANAMSRARPERSASRLRVTSECSVSCRPTARPRRSAAGSAATPSSSSASGNSTLFLDRGID